MRVIIAGSRTITDYEFVKWAIEGAGLDITEVVSGAALGVDRLGERWAKEHGIPTKRFPAKWSDLTVPGAVIKDGAYGKYNAIAGHTRNQQMADYAEALVEI